MCIALLIADDHHMIRLGLRRMFERNGIVVIAEASTPTEAVHHSLQSRVQTVLLDLSWTDAQEVTLRTAGLDILLEIRAARPTLPILMYSANSASAAIEACRRVGANGFLVKGVDEHRLVSAVLAVHAGESVWPSTLQAASAPGSMPRACGGSVNDIASIG